MVSAVASIFFIICLLALMAGFFLDKKVEDETYGLTWAAVTIVLVMCYHAFWAAIINILHVPVNLISLGIIDLVTSFYFWSHIYRKKEIQKYKFEWVDVVFLVVLLVILAWFDKARFEGLSFAINYKTVDPAPRFKEAMDFINNQSVSRMFFAQLTNGLFMEVLAPLKKLDYYYQLYVMEDLVQLGICGLMFFGMIRKYVKGIFLSIASIAAFVIFIMGYPLNSTIYGFTYLGMGITLVALITVLMDLFMKEELPKWFHIILLMLVAHAMFQCYVLFMPVVFVAMILCIFLKQYKKNMLISKDTVLTCLAIFLVPCILGLWYTYMGVFVTDGVTVNSAITNEGAIYRDLYSDFLPFLPLAIFGYIKLVTEEKNRFLSLFTPIFVIFTFGMFVMAGKFHTVSTYYYFKNYYLLWLPVIGLAFIGLYYMKKETKILAVSYFSMWLFVVVLFLGNIENKIQGSNPLLMIDEKSAVYNNLLCFNVNTIKEAPYAANRMDLAHYVYNEILKPDHFKKQVACAYADDQTYWFEGITNQRLNDFKYWQIGYDKYFKNLEKHCDYVSVMTDSVIYTENKAYFDSLEKVYSNDIGFVARVHK